MTTPTQGIERMLGRFDKVERPRVINYLSSHYGICHELAEGIWQEAWIVLWTKLSSGMLDHIPENLKAYMMKICSLKIMESLREKEKAYSCLSLDNETEEHRDVLASEIWSWEDFYERDQRIELYHRYLLDKGLSMLTPKFRALIRGHYYDGKSMEQLAKELGYKDANAAKSTKRRAMIELMAIIKQQERESSPAAVFIYPQSLIRNHQSSIVNHQSSIPNHQSSIPNHLSSITNHLSSITNHLSSIPNH